MSNRLRWVAIIGLLGIYLLVLLALVHPKVSEAYKSFYIRHSTAEWNPSHYPATLQDGIFFGREGLPEWIDSLYGFSFQEPWGRWTDDNYGSVAGLFLAQAVYGPFCVEFTARPSHAMSKSFVVRLGKQSQTVQILPGSLPTYRVQFEGAQWANRLEFVMPKNLPPETDFDPNSGDKRRIGLLIVSLRMTPGQCAAPEN